MLHVPSVKVNLWAQRGTLAGRQEVPQMNFGQDVEPTKFEKKRIGDTWWRRPGWTTMDSGVCPYLGPSGH